jgi:agmatinase
MNSVFNNCFIGSSKDALSARVLIAGCPLDMTSSFRSGTRFAPDSIRKASWTLETYSPYLTRDLEDAQFYDAGNLELPPGNLNQSLLTIQNASDETTGNRRILLGLGGEHLVSFPLIKGLRKHVDRLQVIHFDAHCDLRDDYEGEPLSHATAMKLVKNLGGIDLFQIGIRSGTKQEFNELNAIDSPASLNARIDQNIPVYVTFDLDVLDPSLVPGVTTPEPGGLTFKEVMEYFTVLSKLTLIGADVVELAPDYDATFVSSVTAAKITRELLLLLALN